MKKFYLGFSKGKSKWAIFSKLICWAQKTPFSHVYIRFDSEFLERTFIYQASGTKVNFENIESFGQHSLVVKEFELCVTDEVYKKILQFAIDMVGRPYSLKQIMWIALTIFCQRIGIKINNPYLNRNDAFICSEIGANILSIVGNEVSGNMDYLGPKEVYDLINKT